MGTVAIDEFEVVIDSPPQAVSQAEAEMSAPEDTLTAQDIERIMEQWIERCARIRAH